MKLYLTDQTPNLKKHLDFLKKQQVKNYDISILNEKTTSIELSTTKRIEQLDLTFFFDYRLFPENIMSFKTQWNDEKRKMQQGDTIVQQAYIPPVKSISQKIIFGVRIKEIFDQPNRKGYSYETLEGHVEKGISTFTIEELKDKLVFKIHTYSKPGNTLTTLLGPVFSLPYQAYCTKMALQNVKHLIQEQNNPGIKH